jgi:hypothetical protein
MIDTLRSIVLTTNIRKAETTLTNPLSDASVEGRIALTVRIGFSWSANQ